MHEVFAHALKQRGDMSSRTQGGSIMENRNGPVEETEETKEEKTIEFDLRTTGC